MVRHTPLPVTRALRDIGQDLATWRKLRQLTVAEVADRAGLGRSTVLRLESGQGSSLENMSLENMLRVARALGVIESVSSAMDPYATDVGRLRADEALPLRVRHPRSQS